MARTIDKTLADILKKYGADPATDIWDCHGTWVAYHRTLERIAAQAGITFEPPTMIRSEADECVICVTGHMGDRAEWSFGECKVNQNYRVSKNMSAYPYAMAEKRAKDRVVLKLVGLAGHVYSEEEADNFKDPDQKTKAQSRETYERLQRELDDLPRTMKDPNAIREWWKANADAIKTLPGDWQDTLTARAESNHADMKMSMGNAA